MTGRPSKYSEDLAATICSRLADGEPLRRICRDAGMPSTVTVYRWLQNDEAFRSLYARARDDQADTLADEIVDIADEAPQRISDENGNTRVDSGWVTWQKNRYDARKWIAAKLKPRKYGDKIDVEHTGDVKISVVSYDSTDHPA